MMMQITLKKWFGLVIVLLLVLTGCSAPATPTPTPAPEGVNPIDPPLPIADAGLVDQDGKAWKLSDWKGQYTLFTFGFTHCPDVCPINLANFKQVKNNLQASDVPLPRFVFVSVDGERDTPEILKKHLVLYDESFLGLTGDPTQTAAAAKAFSIAYRLDKTTPDQKEYNVTHSAGSYLVDKNGQLVRIYSYQTSPVVIADDFRKLVQESKG
jgi:protein SCO1